MCFCRHLSCPAAKLQKSHRVNTMDERPLLLTSSTYSASSTYLTSWKQGTGFDHLLCLGNIQPIFVFGSSIHGLASLIARRALILSSTPPPIFSPPNQPWLLPFYRAATLFVVLDILVKLMYAGATLSECVYIYIEAMARAQFDRPSSSVTPVAASDPYKSKTAQI